MTVLPPVMQHADLQSPQQQNPAVWLSVRQSEFQCFYRVLWKDFHTMYTTMVVLVESVIKLAQ